MPIVWSKLEGATRITPKVHGTITMGRDGTLELHTPEWDYKQNYWQTRIQKLKFYEGEEITVLAGIVATVGTKVHAVKLDAEEMRIIAEHRAKRDKETLRLAEQAQEAAEEQARAAMLALMSIEQAVDYYEAEAKRTEGLDYWQRLTAEEAFENVGERFADTIGKELVPRPLLERIRSLRWKGRLGGELKIDTEFGGTEVAA